MKEYQEIIALNEIKAMLKLKIKFGVIGVSKIKPNPIIWKVVFSFPEKSDLRSSIFPFWEKTNSLR